jgi:catechol 2,3-dioxygenase-like lactoylglutathione lyase family enzyme
MEWKLELVVVPVADVERAKQFYHQQLGFVVDHDTPINDTMRVVQLTPPGSACSVALGTGIVAAAPGSLQGIQLVVHDIAQARAELLARGVGVSAVQHYEGAALVDGPGGPWNSFFFFADPDGNGWAVQERPAAPSQDQAMADHVDAPAKQVTSEPSTALKQLDRLVGKWRVTGGVEGTVTYEWMEGGHFLLQHVDFMHDGCSIKGLEVIGHLQPFGQQPSTDIHSRFYDTLGNTLDYVYELDGDSLTIWGGTKGSPAYFRGTWSADNNRCVGGWVYPDGGYESTMIRML